MLINWINIMSLLLSCQIFSPGELLRKMLNSPPPRSVVAVACSQRFPTSLCRPFPGSWQIEGYQKGVRLSDSSPGDPLLLAARLDFVPAARQGPRTPLNCV